MTFLSLDCDHNDYDDYFDRCVSCGMSEADILAEASA